MAETTSANIANVIKGAAKNAVRSMTPADAKAQAKNEDGIVKLKYPNQEPAHQMILKFYEYEYSRVISGEGKYQAQASIALPLPQNFIEATRLEIGGSQLGILGALTTDLLGGTLAGTAGSNIKQDIFNADGTLKDATSLAKGLGSSFEGAIAAGADAAVYLTKAVAGKISPQIGQGISASSGSAVNNQATLIFDGLDLKIHNFEWVFSPKNAEDQKLLDDVMRTINYFIHPDYKSPIKGLDSKTLKRTVSRGLLTYPALMEVTLIGVSGNLDLLFRTKKYLMVNNFNIDYSAGGNLMLNKGGQPGVIRCSMNVTESEIRTRADYRDGLPGNLGQDQAVVDPVSNEDGGFQVDSLVNALTKPNEDGQDQDPAVESGTDDVAGSNEDSPDDRTIAYRVAVGTNSRGRTTYDFYNAAGKKLRSNEQDLRNQYPPKSQFLANPPVDR